MQSSTQAHGSSLPRTCRLGQTRTKTYCCTWFRKALKTLRKWKLTVEVLIAAPISTRSRLKDCWSPRSSNWGDQSEVWCQTFWIHSHSFFAVMFDVLPLDLSGSSFMQAVFDCVVPHYLKDSIAFSETSSFLLCTKFFVDSSLSVPVVVDCWDWPISCRCGHHGWKTCFKSTVQRTLWSKSRRHAAHIQCQKNWCKMPRRVVTHLSTTSALHLSCPSAGTHHLGNFDNPTSCHGSPFKLLCRVSSRMQSAHKCWLAQNSMSLLRSFQRTNTLLLGL